MVIFTKTFKVGIKGTTDFDSLVTAMTKLQARKIYSRQAFKMKKPSKQIIVKKVLKP